VRCCQIRHNFKCIECLCKRRKRIFNLTELTSKFYTFFQKKIGNFWHITHLITTKLSTLKNSPVLAHLYFIMGCHFAQKFSSPGGIQNLPNTDRPKNRGHCFWLAWFLACFNVVLFWMHLLTLYWRDLQHKRCHQPVFRYTQGEVKSQSL